MVDDGIVTSLDEIANRQSLPIQETHRSGALALPQFLPPTWEIPFRAFIRPTFERNGTQTHPEEKLL